MLDLADRTYEAGDSEIKAAYRKLALMYHPDKIGESITQADKEVWLKIQNAYETLIDTTKRDDMIPVSHSMIGCLQKPMKSLKKPF